MKMCLHSFDPGAVSVLIHSFVPRYSRWPSRAGPARNCDREDIDVSAKVMGSGFFWRISLLWGSAHVREEMQKSLKNVILGSGNMQKLMGTRCHKCDAKHVYFYALLWVGVVELDREERFGDATYDEFLSSLGVWAGAWQTSWAELGRCLGQSSADVLARVLQT